MASSHLQIQYPLSLLPVPARKEIANYIDGDKSRFHYLAFYLGFRDPDLVEALWNRGFNGPDNSCTIKLLSEFQHNGGTVQQLYWAFREMNHVAVNIIDQWMPIIHDAHQRHQLAEYRSVQQDSCPCSSCNGQQSQHTWELPQSYHASNPRSLSRQTSAPSAQQRRSPRTSPSMSRAHRRQYQSNRQSLNTENGAERVIHSQNQTSGPLEEQRRVICNCDKCRLQSDPNETQRLTYYSPNNVEECLLQQRVADMSLTPDHQRGAGGVNNNTGQFDSNGAIPKTNKLCANSSEGVHDIGKRPDSCNVCKSFESAKELRHSWHSSDGLPQTPSIQDRNCSSESMINVSEQPTEVIYNRLNILYSVEGIPSENDFNRCENIPNTQSDNYSRTQNSSVPDDHLNDARNGNDIRSIPTVNNQFVHGHPSFNNQSVHGNHSLNNQSVYGNASFNNRNAHGNSSFNSNAHGNLTINNQSVRGSLTNNNSNAHGNSIVNNQNANGNLSFNNQNVHGNPTVNNSNAHGNQSMNSSHGQHNQAPQTTQPTSDQSDDKPVVFITYSLHSNIHIEEIRKLIQLLQQANIRVKIDMDPDSFDDLSLNRNEWLDRMVDNAKYVIICISPTYYTDVREHHNTNDPSPRISQLNAHYIYDRLRTEYINNQSQNRRMIPVLFPKSGASYRNHVPSLMQATLVYSFPLHVDDIIDRILGRKPIKLPYV